MFDEKRIWDQSRDCRGVAVNTLTQIAKVYRPGLAARAYLERAKSIERINTWARKRFLRWEPVFGALGYDKVSTSQLAGHLMRANCSILKDLYTLEGESLIIRDGTKPHPGNGMPLQFWTWIGERNAKH